MLHSKQNLVVSHMYGVPHSSQNFGRLACCLNMAKWQQVKFCMNNFFASLSYATYSFQFNPCYKYEIVKKLSQQQFEGKMTMRVIIPL
jgi:hypothetical protein